VYVNKVDHNNYDLLAEQKLITARIAEEAAAKAVEMKTTKNPKQRPGTEARQPDNEPERRLTTTTSRVNTSKVDCNPVAEQLLIDARIAREAVARVVEMKVAYDDYKPVAERKRIDARIAEEAAAKAVEMKVAVAWM